MLSRTSVIDRRSEEQALAVDFYNKCYLVTPYSSRFFTPQQLYEIVQEFDVYSSQAASLTARLSDIDYSSRPKSGALWINNQSKKNIIIHHLLQDEDDEDDSYDHNSDDNHESGYSRATHVAKVNNMTNEQLSTKLKEICYQELDRGNFHARDYPVAMLLHAIVVRNRYSDSWNWQLLDLGDQLKLLGVYGLLKDIDVDSALHQQHDQQQPEVITSEFINDSFATLLKLQSICAGEVDAHNDMRFEINDVNIVRELMVDI